jgi:hypothetical protein
MSTAERVASHLPYLRRFARTVTGNQKSGDAYVVSTLEAMLMTPTPIPLIILSSALRLYWLPRALATPGRPGRPRRQDYSLKTPAEASEALAPRRACY